MIRLVRVKGEGRSKKCERRGAGGGAIYQLTGKRYSNSHCHCERERNRKKNKLADSQAIHQSNQT